jgi:hypothetical protein
VGWLASPRTLAEGDFAQPLARAAQRIRPAAKAESLGERVAGGRQQMLQAVLCGTLVGLPPFGFLDSRPGHLVSGQTAVRAKAHGHIMNRAGGAIQRGNML